MVGTITKQVVVYDFNAIVPLGLSVSRSPLSASWPTFLHKAAALRPCQLCVCLSLCANLPVLCKSSYHQEGGVHILHMDYLGNPGDYRWEPTFEGPASVVGDACRPRKLHRDLMIGAQQLLRPYFTATRSRTPVTYARNRDARRPPRARSLPTSTRSPVGGTRRGSWPVRMEPLCHRWSGS